MFTTFMASGFRPGLFACFYLSCISLSLAPFSLLAQAPLQVTYSPDPPQQGDSPIFTWDYGTEAEPAPAADSLHLVFAYSGFELVDTGTVWVDLEGSWFGTANEVAALAWLDVSRQELHLQLIRIDAQPVSGFGQIARVGGPIVVIDDLHGRHSASESSLSLEVFPNPSQGIIRVHWMGPAFRQEALIFNSQSQVSWRGWLEIGDQKLNLSNLPAGIYWLRAGSWVKRLQLSP